MRHLIKADIDRILRRKILWIFFAAALLFEAYTVASDISSAPDRNLVFTITAVNGIGNVGLLIGILLVMNIYADDFKSMTFISVIGRGISRQKLIIAKLLDTLLILINVYVISGLFILVLKTVLGVTLSPDMQMYIILQLINDVICTTASVVIAAAFFYLTENSVLGIIAYLTAEILIPVGLAFVDMIPFLARYHPERFYYYGAASSMMTDFMLGATGDAVLKFLMIIVVYILGATLATILLFSKKELDF